MIILHHAAVFKALQYHKNLTSRALYLNRQEIRQKCQEPEVNELNAPNKSETLKASTPSNSALQPNFWKKTLWNSLPIAGQLVQKNAVKDSTKILTKIQIKIHLLLSVSLVQSSSGS